MQVDSIMVWYVNQFFWGPKRYPGQGPGGSVERYSPGALLDEIFMAFRNSKVSVSTEHILARYLLQMYIWSAIFSGKF